VPIPSYEKFPVLIPDIHSLETSQASKLRALIKKTRKWLIRDKSEKNWKLYENLKKTNLPEYLVINSFMT